MVDQDQTQEMNIYDEEGCLSMGDPFLTIQMTW
jgi:hypothetical protein